MRVILVLIFLLTTGVAGVANAGVNEVVQSVVSVLPVWKPGTYNRLEPEGSGIVIGDGSKVLTAAHVVKTARTIRVRTVGGLILSASIVWKDDATDVALLKISDKLKPVTFSSTGSIGDAVCAIGNSFGLGVSVSCGVISATQKTNVGFNQLEDFIQTDAGMNPGKSGGALVDDKLVDDKGRVIGMLSAIFTKKSDADIGVNFAVSSRLIKRLLSQKKQPAGSVWRQSPLALASFPAPGKTGYSGARITDVKPGSVADAFGFQSGDIIIRAGTRRIKNPKDFTTEYAFFEQPNMPVVVLRNNVEMLINWQFKPEKGN